MRLVICLFTLLIALPANPLRAADDSGSSKPTPASEALYLLCLKEARGLQKRYTECATKECRDEVTKDFDVWSAKCFKE